MATKWADLRRTKTHSIIGGSSKATKVRKVGKKFSANKRRPDFPKGSLRWLFCMRFRELVKGKPSEEIATKLGISGDLARKWIGGTRAPDIDDLPAIAEAFGLADWTDLFRPKNS